MRGVPVLGVNLGSLGFMSDLEAGELALLKNLALGRYRKEKRMMLDVSVLREGRTVYTGGALNDAVVTKGATASGEHRGGPAGHLLRGRRGGGHAHRVHGVLALGRRTHRGAHGAEFCYQPHMRPLGVFQILCPLRRRDGDRRPDGAESEAGLSVGGRRKGLLPAAGGPGAHLPVKI